MTDWTEMSEADIETAAQAIAGNNSLWMASRPLVSWDAMHLQLACGHKQGDVAKWFRISQGALCSHAKRHEWRKLGKRSRAELARKLRRALAIRGTLCPEDVSDVQDDVACALRVACPPARACLLPVAAESGETDDVWGETAGAEEPAPARWDAIAHAAQLPPPGAWRTWMLMGGRGAGKTRAGAEWVRALVESGGARRIALVGPTLHDVREVMIDGPSGLRTIAPKATRPKYEAGRRRLVWPGGGAWADAVAYAFSAEDPDSLRGPQFDAAWCDEAGAWVRDVETWRTLAFAMRLGEAPRIVVTTTPRPRALVKLLHGRAAAKRGGVVLTQAGTRVNARNLAPDFVANLEDDYAGTELGRQELDGDLIEDMAGAMWSRAVIESNRARMEDVGKLDRIVVAVDPPAGASARSDACGIVVAGVKDRIVFVLADASVRGLRPAEWAERVMKTARAWGAACVVAEANQGGEMVREVLEKTGVTGVKIKLAHATAAKRDRAAPVSALYEKGRVRHVRVLKELEDEMCAFTLHPIHRARSPDRVDALVWAVTELAAKSQGRPRVGML